MEQSAVFLNPPIMSAPDDLTAVDKYRPDRNSTFSKTLLSLLDRRFHEVIHKKILWLRENDENDLGSDQIQCESMSDPHFRKAMGFGDLVLFYLVTALSLRWIATAAAAGPSSIVIWILGCLTYFVPLTF